MKGHETGGPVPGDTGGQLAEAANGSCKSLTRGTAGVSLEEFNMSTHQGDLWA